jgi:adenylosuccinate synthase
MNKCVDIIVGLQYGSEGKGKIAAHLANDYAAAARVGAPNAGHTIYHKGTQYKMRSIPCAWVNPNCQLFIGAGGMINIEVLKQELTYDMSIASRLHIDPNAVVVTEEDGKAEVENGMFEKIGSTREGVGIAMAKKIMRMRGDSILAGQCRDLFQYVDPTVRLKLYNHICDGNSIILEGTQGFGLCLDHGNYPFVTSRNVLSSSILSECGLPPQCTRHVIGVMRTYPIRVAGNSGPMGAEELQWDDVRKNAGYPDTVTICEKTTVTNRIRRVSHINWPILQDAVSANGCDQLAIMFMDYISHEDLGVTEYSKLSKVSKEFVHMTEMRLGVRVRIISTGPKPEHIITLF